MAQGLGLRVKGGFQGSRLAKKQRWSLMQQLGKIMNIKHNNKAKGIKVVSL